MKRMALRPICLADGTKILKGMTISVDARQLHSETIYPEPDTFKPWRFCELRDSSDAWQSKSQFAAASLEMPGFGYGRQACPGRAFAAHVIKLTIANIILTYDIALPRGQLPDKVMFRSFSIVDPRAKIQFRRRDLDEETAKILDGRSAGCT
jgi:cytochrome P450